MNASLLLAIALIGSLLIAASADPFYQSFYVNWGHDKAQVLNNGELLTLSLDQSSGAGFQSINEYLFAKVEMQLKLVPGNSAGTVTAFYLSSQGDSHDEIDFEFLGNVSGQPYTLHTNVFCQGKGNREQQFYLWFDPTSDFHTYTILWNPQQIIFFVDGIAIREFKNLESSGIPFPKSQPMKVYSSLWEADDWATMGGRMKIDWSLAPFYASYRNFTANGCVGYSAECYTANNNGWLWQSLDYATRGQMKWVQDSFMIYDYCKDNNRFPQGLPLECYTNNNN